jgi:hypothetical protein
MELTTGIYNIQSSINNILVYPNPIQNELIIEGAANCSIHIFDIVGREVYTGVINTPLSFSSPSERPGEAHINAAYFSKGTYFLEITNTDGERIIKKIIKE